ncbi:hypothetical protein EJB05_36782, partial [Eragrostis curvula]
MVRGPDKRHPLWATWISLEQDAIGNFILKGHVEMAPCFTTLLFRPAPVGLPGRPGRPGLKATSLAARAATKTASVVGELAAWKSIRQERWEGVLEPEGSVPRWLVRNEGSRFYHICAVQLRWNDDDHTVCFNLQDGTYLRNGPGLWNADEHEFRHMFDGYATLVRVAFRDGRATGAHRQVESDAYKASRERGKVCHREFSEVPGHDGGLLSRLGELAGLSLGALGAPLTDNANAGVLALADGRVLCMTETVSSSTVIDPGTLDTVGKFRYTDGLGGLVHSAHPVVTASEMWTLVPDLLRPGYLVVRMPAGSNEREVVARVDCRGKTGVGWVHSFAVTERFVVVPEMPLRYSARNLLRAEPTPLYKFEWRPEGGSYMHVVCKASGKTVASVEVPPFVTFHYINAYEEAGADGREAEVVVDCCEHNADTSILDRLRLDNLRSFAGDDVLPDARVGRFRIPLDGSPSGELEAALDPEEHGRGMDMCSINPAYRGKKYRYAYACGARRPCNFPNTLTKVDLAQKKAVTWYEDGAVPSEPLFVARPGAAREDDGVVISLVSAKDGSGFAVLLDGTTFQELARAKFQYGLPYGLHGCWIPRAS